MSEKNMCHAQLPTMIFLSVMFRGYRQRTAEVFLSKKIANRPTERLTDQPNN